MYSTLPWDAGYAHPSHKSSSFPFQPIHNILDLGSKNIAQDLLKPAAVCKEISVREYQDAEMRCGDIRNEMINQQKKNRPNEDAIEHRRGT
jgi:hypothetical protein